MEVSRRQLRSSCIVGTGCYFPDRVLTNQDLERMVDTSDEWITSRTGIKERRIAAPEQACSDLAVPAAERALSMAGLEASDLDAIVVGTLSGDMQFPATAAFVQDRLGAKNVAAFDISAACSGFIYAVNVAHGLIASHQAENVLVIGAEVLSKFVDWDDRATCVLFGDGAGAAVMQACPMGEGIISTHMRSDGSLAELLCIPGGGSRYPLSEATLDEHGQFIKMKGDGVFKWAVRAMTDTTRQVVQDSGYALEDVALFVPHQANLRIIEAVVDRLEIDTKIVAVNLDRFGNTSAGTIPTAFDECVRGGRVKPGDLVVFAGFGGGFTWGSVLFRNSLGVAGEDAVA